jgi:hypothetical protein
VEIESKGLSVLVTAPSPNDLSFYARWFLAANRVETLWRTTCANPLLKGRIDRLLFSFIPDFTITASEFYRSLQHHSPGFILCLEDAVANEFVIMADLGFFAPHGDHYRLALPPRLELHQVMAAAAKYAATEDSEHMLHPEKLVRAMLSSSTFAPQDAGNSSICGDERSGHVTLVCASSATEWVLVPWRHVRAVTYRTSVNPREAAGFRRI